jgi:hypothetical protein
VRITSEAAARFEEEREARAAAEHAKAEAEANLLELEARVSETEARLRQAEDRFRQAEDRFRQAEAGLQQEASKRNLAEEKANEIEVRLAAETARIKADADAKIQGMGAETRRIEENYKGEIDWIRRELEEALKAAKQADENHRSEMTRITFEAESRALQAEANVRQYQIKIEEAIASAQAAMFNLEETQKTLEGTEARLREMERRARQAETRSQRLYLISKLAFTSAEQVIAENLNAGDENDGGATVISLDHAANTYLDGLPAEASPFAANGSTDYGDYQFSDRMRALFQAAARANATEDKSGKVSGDELRMASGE